MTSRHFGAGAKFALALLISPVPASQLCAESGDPAIALEYRTVAASRPVAVSVPQERLETSIFLGRIAPPGYGGGLIGALIMAARDDREETLTNNAFSEADRIAEPLFTELDGFDVPSLAVQATQAAFATPTWFEPGTAELMPGSEPEDYEVFLATSPDAEQFAIANYRYQLSSDFTQIQVIAAFELAHAEDLKPIYRQDVVSIVRLDRPSFVPEENIARWAADDALLARNALTAAFDRMAQIAPVVLELDKDQFKTVTDKKRESAVTAGFFGPLLQRDEAGPVIWDKDVGFIAVQIAK